VAGRIAAAVLRDEWMVFPDGSYNPRFGVALSLLSVVGNVGVREVLWPEMPEDEAYAPEHSADTLRQAVSIFLC
jgi:L-lactate dehydrogenase